MQGAFEGYKEGGDEMLLKELLPKVKLERESEVRKKVAIGAAVGLTVGAVAGVLLAPKAGKDCREGLMNTIHELPEMVKPSSDKTRKVTEEANEIITEEKHKIKTGEKVALLDIDKDLYNELHSRELNVKAETGAVAINKKLK
jgi:gas vesicle protein